MSAKYMLTLYFDGYSTEKLAISNLQVRQNSTYPNLNLSLLIL